MKIFVVDDSQTMRDLAELTLEEMGYKDVLVFGSAKPALDALESNKPNLILLDWHMPGYTGLDFLRIVKNNDKYKDIAVIMLTSEEHPQSMQEAIQSGASAYITKPILPESFKETISRVIGH